MNRMDIRSALRGTAERIRSGQPTELVNGVEGLLFDADQYIEDQDKEYVKEINTIKNAMVTDAGKYQQDIDRLRAKCRALTEALQSCKTEVNNLRERLNESDDGKTTFKRMVLHFLDNE